MNNVTLLPIVDTIRGAWEKVSGAKATLWIAFAFIIVLSIINIALQAYLKEHSNTVLSVVDFLLQVITYLLQMGLLYLGIQRALGRPLVWQDVFMGLKPAMTIKIILLYLLQILVLILPIIVIIGGIAIAGVANQDRTMAAMFVSALLVFLGSIAIIFIMFRMMLSFGYLLEEKLGPWDAIKKSFAATRGNVWRLIFIHLIFAILFFISMIPFGIGLIWTLPLSVILYGEIYRRLNSDQNLVTT